MISEVCGLEQLARLGQMFRLPADESVQDELIKAYQEASRDDQRAVEITDHLVQHLHHCPVPADIRTCAQQLAGSTESLPEWRSTRRDAVCQACRGDGWIQAYEIHARLSDRTERRRIPDNLAAEFSHGIRDLSENEEIVAVAVRCEECRSRKLQSKSEERHAIHAVR